MEVRYNFHPLNELIMSLRRAYRNAAYLAFLRLQKCWSCPARNEITASHIFRGYHGMKNHDWAALPMCPWCHWEYEYHKELFIKRRHLPVAADAEAFFQRFLKETGRHDDRTEDQLRPA